MPSESHTDNAARQRGELKRLVGWVLKTQDDCVIERNSLWRDLIKLEYKSYKIAEFGLDQVKDRIYALQRNPILWRRGRQIRAITQTFLKAGHSYIDFSEKLTELRDTMGTEDERIKNLVSISDEETLKKMSIQSVKIGLGAWNERLLLFRDMKAEMDEFAAEWDELEVLQGFQECNKLIDSLWLENQ